VSAPEPPLEEQSFQIVFSSDPGALENAGWTPDRLLASGDPALGGDRRSDNGPGPG